MKTIFLIIFSLGLLCFFGITESFSEESSVSYNVGQIKWFEWNAHSKIPSSNIQVTDQDMNENSDEIDKFNIHIWSDSDSIGIVVLLYETEKDSGIFDSPIYFSEEFSTGQRLRVSDGGVVTAKYEDKTLPTSYTSENLEISDTLMIYYPLIDVNQNSFIRIADDSFNRQSLQTGETISASGTFTSIIAGSLGPILIVLFIVIYAVKKRRKKSIEERK